MTGTVRMTARPIDQWPGQLRDPADRTRSAFNVTWTATTVQLRKEVSLLAPAGGATELVLHLAINEDELRSDGWVLETARPAHPGVVLSFDSRHGPLQFHSDLYRDPASFTSTAVPGWQANARAIADGLESLRLIDRYGITHEGEQYRGWLAFETPTAPLDPEAAAEFLVAHGRWGSNHSEPGELLGNSELVDVYYRAAAKRLHPARGGDPALFRRATEARDLLQAATS